MAPIAIASRGVAFLIPVLIAHLFGVSGTTDAFFYALAFPTFLMVMVANAFGTVLTPLIARIQATNPDELPAFLGGAVTLAALGSLAVGVLILVGLGPLLPVMTRFAVREQGLTWRFVAELLPFMTLVGTAVVLRSACEVRGRFLPVTLTPMLRGVTVMASLLLLHAPLGARALSIALLLGQVVEVAWLLLLLAQGGLWLRLGWALDPRLRSALHDLLPILGGETLVAFNVVVDKAFAGLSDPGSVSLLEYADRTRYIPQTLLESTLLSVAFATWANLVAREDRRGFATQVGQSLRWVAAFSAPPLAGLHIGRYVLVSTLYVRGEFSEADALASAEAFGWFLPGLWSMMLGTLAMRAHVVERRLGLVLALGAVSVVLNATLDAILMPSLGISGLALASSIVWVVVPAAYLAALAPTLRPITQASQWVGVFAVVALSLLVAAGVEAWGSPRTFADPVLWVAAAACFVLLGLAAAVTRTASGRAP
jgi:putative peptidoglycan lipid II flippase